MKQRDKDHQTGLYQHKDNCDGCGVQAYVIYQQVDRDGKTHELKFCAHHAHTHGLDLESQGWVKVVDETHTINVRPSISANAE